MNCAATKVKSPSSWAFGRNELRRYDGEVTLVVGLQAQ
jgi:hypothetical protein